MRQQLQKPFTCFGCKQEIKLQRKDDDSGWIRFEADGHTIHNCERKNKKAQEQELQQQQQPSPGGPSNSTEISKEVVAIKAQLLVLVGRLDRLEQELGK